MPLGRLRLYRVTGEVDPHVLAWAVSGCLPQVAGRKNGSSGNSRCKAAYGLNCAIERVRVRRTDGADDCPPSMERAYMSWYDTFWRLRLMVTRCVGARRIDEMLDCGPESSLLLRMIGGERKTPAQPA